MGRIRLLIPEILGSQAGKVDASSEASASTPAQNLTTPELWQIWRSESNDLADAMVTGYINGRPQINVDGVALAGLNMVPGNGEIRATLITDQASLPGFVAFEELVPTSIAASSGITGAVSTVDEGSGATDGARTYENAAGGGAYVIYNFPTPTNDPTPGARRQCFVLRCLAASDPTGPYTPIDTSGDLAYRRPSFTVSLYQDVAGTPTPIEELATKAVFGPDLHLLFFSWDAALLADSSGAGVQVRIDFLGTVFGPTEYHPDLDSVYWACDSNHVEYLGVSGDSGWKQITPLADSGVGYDYSTQLGVARTRWSHKFDTVAQPQSVLVQIREDHVPAEETNRLNRFLLRQPVSYVQAGRLCVGLWWSPAVNRAQGHYITVTDPSLVVDDEDGGAFGSRRESFDDLRIVLENLTEQEMAWLSGRLRDYGTLASFYIELEPDATVELHTGGWARLLSTQFQISRRNTDVYKYSMEFSVRVQR